MKISKHLSGFAVILLAALALLVSFGTGNALAQKLYISDASDNSVKVVDLNLFNKTGVVDYFVKPGNGGLKGPRGILFNGNNLLLANQNAGLNIPGEILSFAGPTATVPGAFLGAFVAASDKKNAPFLPRGIILGNQTDADAAFLYVANLAADGHSPGLVNTYDKNGDFLAGLEAKGFPNKEFHPRGVVFGPDGNLYVSLRTIQGKYHGADPGGWVLRFKPDGSFDVFIADPGGVGKLNRPEGLVFGPDGNLYITSFPASAQDTSSIRIYDSQGAFLKKIDLGKFDDSPNSPPAFAIALLFGPDGNLFVPIYNTPDIPNSTGQLRSYNINDLNNIVETVYTLSSPNPDLNPDLGKKPLLAPWYLTFETTDPHTLAYE